MMATMGELGAWTVPLALLAATAFLAWLWLVRRPRTTLAILLVGLPLHTVAFQVASAHLPAFLVIGLRLWREALLVALGVAMVRQWGQVRQHLARYWPVVGALGLYGVTLLVGAWRAESVAAALAGFRLAAIPLAVFVVCLCLPYDLCDLERMVWYLLGMGVFISLFALYQGYVLGPGFLWRYYATDGRLAHSFEVGGSPIQRLMGTFASPNQLALYLVFLIMMAASLFMALRRSHWLLFGAGSLYLLVLALTVSRSGWAGLVLGGMALILFWWHRWELWLALMGLAGLGVGVMAQRGLLVRLRDLVSLREVSAAYHIATGWDNLQTIARNPLGFGLGSAGALSRAAAAAGLTEARYPTESFLLQIGLQQGVQGMLAFGILVCAVAMGLVRSFRSVERPFCRALALAALASLAGAMVHAFMNVDLQDIAVQSCLWFLVAMGLRLPAFEAAEHEGAAGA